MKNYIKLQDVVQIESNPFFPALVGSRGVVKQVLEGKQVLIGFHTNQRNVDPKNLKEVFEATDWLLPLKYVSLIESERDTLVESLELKIVELEDSLTLARAVLVVSEELREKQFYEIEKQNLEIDFLKKKLYDDFK